MASIKELLQYRGNKNYICCYCQDDENKNFVIFARTGGLYFNSEVDQNFELEWSTKKIVPPLTKHNIDIPLSKQYYIMYVDDFKDYELINRILEVVWVEDN